MTVTRLLLVPVVAAGMFFVLCVLPAHPWTVAGAAGAVGAAGAAEVTGPAAGSSSAPAWARVDLRYKDDARSAVAPSRPPASGAVWYTLSGPALGIQAHAEGLDPSAPYILEVEVDGRRLDVARRPADPIGRLDIDTSLDCFTSRPCGADSLAASISVAGPHAVRYALRSAPSSEGTPGCGVGDVARAAYVLVDEKYTRFTGRP